MSQPTETTAHVMSIRKEEGGVLFGWESGRADIGPILNILSTTPGVVQHSFRLHWVSVATLHALLPLFVNGTEAWAGVVHNGAYPMPAPHNHNNARGSTRQSREGAPNRSRHKSRERRAA